MCKKPPKRIVESARLLQATPPSYKPIEPLIFCENIKPRPRSLYSPAVITQQSVKTQSSRKPPISDPDIICLDDDSSPKNQRIIKEDIPAGKQFFELVLFTKKMKM